MAQMLACTGRHLLSQQARHAARLLAAWQESFPLFSTSSNAWSGGGSIGSSVGSIGNSFSSNAGADAHQEGPPETRQAWKPPGMGSAANTTAEAHGPTTSTAASPVAGAEADSAGLSELARTHAAVLSDMCAVLHRMELQPGLGCEVAEGMATLDLAVMFGDLQVAVDVVPSPQLAPSSTPQRQYALSAARRMLLLSHGWVLLQVPIVEWLQQGSEHDKRMYLAMKLQELQEQQQGGAGHVCGSGCSH